MFSGKTKAFTLSYDDGVTQDRRLCALLGKYGLKCTFNINTGRLGKTAEILCDGVAVTHNKIEASEVASLYAGHEVAVHTLTHPNLTKLSDEDVVRQVEEDRKAIEALVGYEVVGMAYPGGQYDERIRSLLSGRTKIRYSRTVENTDSFDRQEDLLQFSANAHHLDWKRLYALGEAFLNDTSGKEQIFYVWGHSYELDVSDNWEKLEEFFRFIAGHDDVFYGTNREVLLP